MIAKSARVNKLNDIRNTCKLTVIIIVTDDNLLYLAILAHLAPEILVKGIKVRL